MSYPIRTPRPPIEEFRRRLFKAPTSMLSRMKLNVVGVGGSKSLRVQTRHEDVMNHVTQIASVFPGVTSYRVDMHGVTVNFS